MVVFVREFTSKRRADVVTETLRGAERYKAGVIP